jgi:peptide/nickel transport system permease protein
MSNSTSNDEYSARVRETDDAAEQEGTLSGRPFEVRSATGGLFRGLLSDKSGVFGLVVLAILGLTAIFAPFLAPYGPAEGTLSSADLPPFWSDGGSWSFVLGTDLQGYDMLSRLIYGLRTTLFISSMVVIIAGSVGITLGLISGYIGGRTDRWISGWTDVQVAFPGLLIAMIMIAVLGGSTWTLIFVLAFNGWMVFARMTRGVVMSVKQEAYVEAAELIGAKTTRIMFKHILPNLTSALLTLGVLEFARIILAEATLSFLGLGLQFPDVSLGVVANMGRDAVFSDPRLSVIPGIVVSALVLAMNFVASWLRVALDPRERDKRFASRVVAGM